MDKIILRLQKLDNKMQNEKEYELHFTIEHLIHLLQYYNSKEESRKAEIKLNKKKDKALSRILKKFRRWKKWCN